MRRSRLWPDPIDELLLRAALLDAPEAIDAWRAWQQEMGGEFPDYTQQRLLPLLHQNLRRLGVADPSLDEYRAEMRATWARCQQLRRFAVLRSQELAALGIPSLVLKGVPLAFGYYSNPGLRPMSDVDVLVHPPDAARATRFFLDRGWECTDEFISSLEDLPHLIPIRHGFNLRDPEEDIEIDLHWSAFRNSLASSGPLWDSAISLSPGLTTLCPTDQLLHTFAQGAGWNVVRPIRWIPDANAILGKAVVDWERLVELAEHFSLTNAVADGLDVLEGLVSFECPHDVRGRLRSIRTSFSVRMDYRLSATKPLPVIGRPLQRYFQYRCIGRPRGLGFLEYLRQLWGLSSVGQVFTQGFRHVFDTVGRRG